MSPFREANAVRHSIPSGIVEIDGVCDSFEDCFRRGGTPNIAEYLDQVPTARRALLKEHLQSIEQYWVDRRAEAGLNCNSDRCEGGQIPQSDGQVDAQTNPVIGECLGGFQLLGVLGTGGFGTVYRAKDLRIGRMVALKVLRRETLGIGDAKERVLNEARALGAIHHDNVVEIYQVGEDRGHPYIALPLLAGETLAARIEREGALPECEVRRIGRQIALGLGAIHAKGMIHRDLKPSNIWLESGVGRVKVLDLGLAHDLSRLPDEISGTPSYMSPEQALGQTLDPRSDLFSLGAILYCCATGRPPFTGSQQTQVLDAVCTVQPASITKFQPALSLELVDLVEHLLQKNPQDRQVAAGHVADCLGMNRSAPKLLHTIRRPLTVAGLLLLTVVASFLYRPNRTEKHDGVDESNVQNTIESAEKPLEPLRVTSLDVRHYAMISDTETHPRGVIGRESFEIRIDDEIDATVTLNRPGYCYLIIFHPDGKDTVLSPQDDFDLPEWSSTVNYPSKRPRERYYLEEQEQPGLWMVAVFVSETPLPSYSQWRRHLGTSPWRSIPVTEPRLVTVHDGTRLETRPSGLRGSKVSRDQSPVREIVDWFREHGASTAAAVSFEVQRRTE